MEIYLYGTIAFVVLFFVITYAVRLGIDTSKQMRALRSELKEIKKKIDRMENEK